MRQVSEYSVQRWGVFANSPMNNCIDAHKLLSPPSVAMEYV